MYARDCPKIAAHALASPDGLVDVIAFVLSSIQTPLSRVGACMLDIRAHGDQAKALWGHKRAGYQYARTHSASLHSAIKAAVKNNDPEFAIDCLTLVPNLGLAKAAFVAQLCGLDVACLDQHNLKRLGMKDSDLKFTKGATEETRRAKIARYVALTRETGGAEYWWDTWCEHIASRGRMNKHLDTADKVSAYHAQCFNL